MCWANSNDPNKTHCSCGTYFLEAKQKVMEMKKREKEPPRADDC